MADNVRELRPRPGSDAEKITINLGYVDLGHIDLLVQDGFYSNRTDFIRTAIRNQIERHADAARQSVRRRSSTLASSTTAARTSKWPVRPDSHSPFGCSAWSASPRTSRLNWPARPSPQFPCSALFKPVRQ